MEDTTHLKLPTYKATETKDCIRAAFLNNKIGPEQAEALMQLVRRGELAEAEQRLREIQEGRG